MAAFFKTFGVMFLLVQVAQSKDHSSHNCCSLRVAGWIPENEWTRAVCEQRWGAVATFDGVKCIEKDGNVISGDDFYNACIIYTSEKKLDVVTGAGYRGTCE